MVADLLFRVVYISTNQSEGVVREVLGQCGVIRGIYPWMAGDHRGQTHFFVEFSSSEEVEHAKALKPLVDSFGVHSVAFNTQLTANFLSIAPSQFKLDSILNREKKSSRNPDVGISQGDTSSRRISANRRQPAASLKRKNSFSSGSADRSHRTSLNRGIAVSGYLQEGDDKENNADVFLLEAQDTKPLSEGPHFPPNTHPPQPHAQFVNNKSSLFSPTQVSLSTTSTSPSDAKDLAPNAKTEPIPECIPLLPLPSNTSSLQSTATAHSPPSNRLSETEAGVAPSLVLCYRGEQFTCELDALTQDPENVIFLLQQTSTSSMDRDKWMIVAAYYRRKQNVFAAAAVVSAMLDAMKSPAVGLLDEDLGPAFLMLASCYNDLRRRADKRIDAGPRNQYLAKAEECFRKVYGATDAPMFNVPSVPKAAIRKNKKKKAASSISAETHKDQAKLQREVQSLRDRHTNNIANLAEARNAKRKLEDELEQERNVRRKIESEVKQKNEELESARRSEQFALDLCKREVLSRRKAEERAAEVSELRERVRTLREELGEKENKFRELSEKMKQKGEMIAVAAAKLVELSGLDVDSVLEKYLRDGLGLRAQCPLAITASGNFRVRRG
ncbi:hypothetical protein BDY19DRAFT_922601 [Irpex rosettiformis]|uniref:Uncharacterized protein n=1 Tax=Irpex rosettiformis TaxID=378272 RepID=A0ACB8UFQ6_9APHY|nr:hypothetical protein BDY19DRAFT_922601 [Irpex rosettiformis]